MTASMLPDITLACYLSTQSDVGLAPRRGLDATARVCHFRLWCHGPFREQPLDPCYHRSDPRQMLEVGMDDQPHFTRENRLCAAQSGDFGNAIPDTARQQRAAQARTDRV